MTRARTATISFASVLLWLAPAAVAHAQLATLGATVQRLFEDRCFSCHGDVIRPGPNANRRRVAEYVTGKAMPLVDVLAPTQGKCAAPAPAIGDPFSAPHWNGWGVDAGNGRFQPARQAGLDAADIPKLKLKWAFGFPGVTQAYAQPVVAAGRMFVGSETGLVYALDAGTGCFYWTFPAMGPVRTTIALARSDRAKSGTVLYFGDVRSNMYAVDAQTGTMVWTQKIDEHPHGRITGSPTLVDGRLYVPVAGMTEEAQVGNPEYECCTFRGSLVAMDAASGRVHWKSYTIAETPKPRGKNAKGTPLYGPAGASIWSAPTVDLEGGAVYVGTGNGFTQVAECHPAKAAAITATPDAVFAGSLDGYMRAYATADGRLLWEYNTAVPFKTVNGVEATGGSISGAVGGQQKRIPRFVVEPGWPKPGPRSWVTDRLVTEEMGATCTDAKGHVVALNRGTLLPIETSLTLKPAPPIIEFDPSGTVVKAWGDRSLLPQGLHGCLVDHENNLWIGGSGDGIVQKWARDGSRMLLQIGTKGTCDGPDGKCGSPGLNASRTLLNQPADVAIDPTSGEIYIADGYGNHRIVVFDRDGRYLRQWGSAGTGPGQFTPSGGGHPHCVVIHRGLLYVCDRGNARIQVFDPMGSLKEIIDVKPGSGDFGSSSDVDFSPDGRFMYINDHGNSVLWIYEMASRTIVGGFGRAGRVAGEWNSFHSLAVDPMGNIYTGEVTGRRLQKFVPKGTVLPARLSSFLGRPHYDAVP